MKWEISSKWTWVAVFEGLHVMIHGSSADEMGWRLWTCSLMLTATTRSSLSYSSETTLLGSNKCCCPQRLNIFVLMVWGARKSDYDCIGTENSNLVPPPPPPSPATVTQHSTLTQRHVPRLSWWLVHLSITYLLPNGYRYVYYLTGHRTQCRLRAHCCITACPYVTPCPVSSVQAAADCHDSWHDANRSVQRSCFVCLPHWHCYNLIVMIHIIF